MIWIQKQGKILVNSVDSVKLQHSKERFEDNNFCDESYIYKYELTIYLWVEKCVKNQKVEICVFLPRSYAHFSRNQRSISFYWIGLLTKLFIVNRRSFVWFSTFTYSLLLADWIQDLEERHKTLARDPFTRLGTPCAFFRFTCSPAADWRMDSFVCFLWGLKSLWEQKNKAGSTAILEIKKKKKKKKKCVACLFFGFYLPFYIILTNTEFSKLFFSSPARSYSISVLVRIEGFEQMSERQGWFALTRPLFPWFFPPFLSLCCRVIQKALSLCVSVCNSCWCVVYVYVCFVMYFKVQINGFGWFFIFISKNSSVYEIIKINNKQIMDLLVYWITTK